MKIKGWLLYIWKASLVAVVFFPLVASAQDIYKWKDKKGQWHFSDQAPPPNASNVEQRSVPRLIPYELRKDRPCSPFEPGEIRHFKANRPSEDFFHLELIDLSLQRVESSTTTSSFSWKLTVKNNSTRRDAFGGVIKLLDCYDFPVAEQPIKWTALRPGEQTTVNGIIAVAATTALKVGRFSGSWSGLNSSKSAEPEKRAAPAMAPMSRPADLRIYWTQLQNTSTGIFFYGEVMNAGGRTASHVTVSFIIKTEHGATVTRDVATTEPATLRPGETGFFRKRVPFLTGVGGHSWTSKAEYSE